MSPRKMLFNKHNLLKTCFTKKKLPRIVLPEPFIQQKNFSLMTFFHQKTFFSKELLSQKNFFHQKTDVTKQHVSEKKHISSQKKTYFFVQLKTNFTKKSQKIKCWQNSTSQTVTKLKNSNCYKTQKFKFENSITQIVAKLKNSNCDSSKTQIGTKTENVTFQK